MRALQAGIAALAPEPPEIVVNVDADISMEADYFERLLERFDADSSLGIASGSAFELQRGSWQQRYVTGTTVWGASRAYRWECLQELLPLEERVAWDGVDEFKANARGWRTTAFEDLPFRHHRREGERDGSAWRARRNQGDAAYYLGYRPWYLVLRALVERSPRAGRARDDLGLCGRRAQAGAAQPGSGGARVPPATAEPAEPEAPRPRGCGTPSARARLKRQVATRSGGRTRRRMCCGRPT